MWFRLTVRLIAVAAALFFLVVGGWAFFAPESFAAHVATFPPYNRHLTHDVGAFSLGLGAAASLALVASDALLVALASLGIGSAVHAVSHLLDRTLGGRSSDPWTLGGFAALVLIGAGLRLREIR